MEIYNNDKSTVIIILDGWEKQTYKKLLHENKLNGIKKLIEDGVALDNIISNLPSVSIASHLSILSGSFIEKHDIPGHRWLDRSRKKIITYFHAKASANVNKDISTKIKTVYEYPYFDKTISIQSIINRGADKAYFYPTMNSTFLLKKTASAIKNNRNSLVVTWLPKVDAIAHTCGPNSKKIEIEMQKTSAAIDDLILYLKKNNLYENLKIILIPDHGQRSVVKSVKIEKLFKKIGLKAAVNTRKYDEKKQLILTSGDSSAQVYLTPNYKNIRAEIAEKLSGFEQIEIICWKDKKDWHILNKYGYTIANWIDVDKNRVYYRLIYGNDPLRLLGSRQDKIMDLTHPYTNTLYPDFLHQIMKSYVEEKSGDMILFPSKKYHFGRAPRFGYRMGFHKGTHGGPFSEEVIVSGVCKGANIEDKPIRLADVLGLFLQ